MAGAATAASADDETAPAASAGEPVAVIDVRPPTGSTEASRARLVAALGQISGVRVVDDERADALAGRVVDSDDRLAAAALAEAREAFGGLDCGRARPAAEDAVHLLAGRQAAGLDETVRLKAAWTYVLLCAERDGDPSVARGAADRLRALGGSPSVPADTWARYPEIDATLDRDIVALAVVGPKGARVWVDHVEVGAAPVTTYVSAGKHVVAAASGTVRGATTITAHGSALTVQVATEERRARFGGIAAQVAAWQVGTAPTAVELTEVMAALEVRFAIVLDRGGKAALWAKGPDASIASLAVDGAIGKPLDLAAGVVARVEYWTEGGPDPDQPLLRETDVPARSKASDKDPARWWVYAAIVGALTAGAVTIYAVGAGEDRQRIELDF